MRINNVKMDISTVPQGYCLVGAFSTDMKFEVGTPGLFNRMFDITNRIDEKCKVGTAKRIDNLYMLFVKESSYDMPDYGALEQALDDLREKLIKKKVKKIAMPKICTGTGNLDWQEIEDLICTIFDEDDIEILVCDY